MVHQMQTLTADFSMASEISYWLTNLIVTFRSFLVVRLVRLDNSLTVAPGKYLRMMNAYMSAEVMIKRDKFEFLNDIWREKYWVKIVGALYPAVDENYKLGHVPNIIKKGTN